MYWLEVVDCFVLRLIKWRQQMCADGERHVFWDSSSIQTCEEHIHIDIGLLRSMLDWTNNKLAIIDATTVWRTWCLRCAVQLGLHFWNYNFVSIIACSDSNSCAQKEKKRKKPATHMKSRSNDNFWDVNLCLCVQHNKVFIVWFS